MPRQSPALRKLFPPLEPSSIARFTIPTHPHFMKRLLLLLAFFAMLPPLSAQETDTTSTAPIDVEDIIYASGIPRLRVIPVGSHCESGAEYFSSQKMQHFLVL